MLTEPNSCLTRLKKVFISFLFENFGGVGTKS